MTSKIYCLILIVFSFHFSFAEDVYLTAEDNSTLTAESGEKLVIEGNSYNLKDFVKAKSGKIEYEKKSKTAKITLPSKETIELTKNTSNQWIPIASTNMKLFDVWQIKIAVIKSIPNALVTLQGCGQNFTTNNKGSGEETFIIDAQPSEHLLTVNKIGEQEVSTNLKIDSKKNIKCTGSKKLKCSLK